MATSTLKKITPADIGAVAKSGDTMTGSLEIRGSDIVISNSTWQWIWFNNLNGKHIASVRGDENLGNRVVFRNQTPNASSDDVCEDYALPAPTADSYKLYDILTSKSPVTVQQGGTGATTPNGACENINAVNSKTDSDRRISSGSVNDAPLGMASYSGQNDNVTQKPYSFWFDVFTFKSTETNYTRQIAVPWSNNRSIAFRAQINGTWSSWCYIATQTTEPTA